MKKTYKSWLFQANPQRFDINQYLINCSKHNDYIYFQINQHKQDIKMGDTAFIWRTKSDSKNPRGIIACGLIEEINPRNKITYPKALEENLWSDKKDINESGLVAGIKIVQIYLNAGMITDEILKDELFNGFSKNWQQTNLSLSVEQANLVINLLNFNINNDNQSNEIDMVFTRPEGRLIQSIHLRRERNPQLINEAKKLFKKTNGGKLFCEICRFSFEEVYGSIGENFIEAHHIIPVSQMKIDHKTSISELMMLCSNCHRMAHRENGMETLQNIKKSLGHEKNQ
ncbi:HNH endonuclease [Legionella genomosp. 1]|uniref:HNH endonuclease n=1 Tax=Legionella genomosp. 1 TaxID=1093625 RepID=UPI0013EF73C5|nr:HNH endonuclease [Legionella genomosp. 1]